MKSRRKPLTADEILKLRLSVSHIIDWFDAMPSGRNIAVGDIQKELANWKDRDATKAEVRKSNQRASQEKHPTIITHPSAECVLPDGIESMTIRIKPLKKKQNKEQKNGD